MNIKRNRLSDRLIVVLLLGTLIGGWLSITVVPARAQSKYLVAPDKLEYTADETITVRAMIPPDRSPESFIFVLTRTDKAAPSISFRYDPRAFQAQILPPAEPGEYEIQVLEHGQMAGKSIHFRVVSTPPTSTGRPGRGDSQLSPQGNWNGTWGTTWGTMTIRQDGNKLAGTYTYRNGRFTATLRLGNRAEGRWEEGQADSDEYRGNLSFEMAPDGRSFSGAFSKGFDQPMRGNWQGTRAFAGGSTDSVGNSQPPKVERDDSDAEGTVIRIRLRPWKASPSSPMTFNLEHQGFSGSLDSVQRDDEFGVDVQIAKNPEGDADRFADTIKIAFTLPDGASPRTLKLTHRGGGNYSNTAPFTASSGGGQTLTIGGFEFNGGGPGGLKVKSGGIVSARHGDKFVDFKVYDTPLQLALGRFNDSFYRLREGLQFRQRHDGLSPRELLEWRHPDTSPERRAALELLRLKQPGRKQDLDGRLRFIDHYFNIIESDEYRHENTKLEFAKVYSGLVQNNNNNNDILGLHSHYPPGFAKSKHGFSFVNQHEKQQYEYAVEEAKKEKTAKVLSGAAGVAFGLYQWTLDSVSFEIPGTGIGLGPGDIYMLTTGINPQTGKPATADDYRDLALGITVGAALKVAGDRLGTDQIEDAVAGPERTTSATGVADGTGTGQASTPGVPPTSVSKPSTGSATSPQAGGSVSAANNSGTGSASTSGVTPTSVGKPSTPGSAGGSVSAANNSGTGSASTPGVTPTSLGNPSTPGSAGGSVSAANNSGTVSASTPGVTPTSAGNPSAPGFATSPQASGSASAANSSAPLPSSSPTGTGTNVANTTPAPGLSSLDRAKAKKRAKADAETLEKVNEAKAQNLQQRRKELGWDPKRGQYLDHEADVGPEIEAKYGYFRRADEKKGEAGDWISLSGSSKGESFDLLGLGPGKGKYYDDKMLAVGPNIDPNAFFATVDHHFLKSVDRLVLDLRNMNPMQKKAVLDYINLNWTHQKHRLIELH